MADEAEENEETSGEEGAGEDKTEINVKKGVSLIVEVTDELEEEETPNKNNELLIEEYLQLQEERRFQRRKNTYLHRKMMEYFKKRNLYIQPDPPNVPKNEIIENYQRHLSLLSDKLDWCENKEKQVNAELTNLRQTLQEKEKNFETTFETLLKRERDMSIGSINTKTGDIISEQIVERYIRLQKQKIQTVADVRQKTIKIENKLAEKEKALKAVEALGDNLSLADFERLTFEHGNLIDKIDERENELGKLHDKYTSDVHILTHLKETSYAITADIHRIENKLKNVENKFFDVRNKLNQVKILRDQCRSDERSIRDNCGLLTQTRLLRDFENVIVNVDKLKNDLERLRNNYENEKNQLYELRKKIDETNITNSIMKPKILFTSIASNDSKQLNVNREQNRIFSPELPPRETSSVLIQSIFDEYSKKKS